MKNAYVFWYRNYRYTEADERVGPFLDPAMMPHKSSGSHWLRRAREALMISTTALANKLDVCRSTYTDYEKCETAGTISLNTLARVAEAIDCELVYAIRPKNNELFSKVIWARLMKELETRKTRRSAAHMKHHAYAADATDLMEKPDCRRRQGWTERKQ